MTTKERCQCTVCGLYFLGEQAFDAHRVGKVGTPKRRCLTVPEMQRRGFSRTPRGNWVAPKRKPAAASFTRSAARLADASNRRRPLHEQTN